MTNSHAAIANGERTGASKHPDRPDGASAGAWASPVSASTAQFEVSGHRDGGERANTSSTVTRRIPASSGRAVRRPDIVHRCTIRAQHAPRSAEPPLRSSRVRRRVQRSARKPFSLIRGPCPATYRRFWERLAPSPAHALIAEYAGSAPLSARNIQDPRGARPARATPTNNSSVEVWLAAPAKYAVREIPDRRVSHNGRRVGYVCARL